MSGRGRRTRREVKAEIDLIDLALENRPFDDTTRAELRGAQSALRWSIGEGPGPLAVAMVRWQMAFRMNLPTTKRETDRIALCGSRSVGSRVEAPLRRQGKGAKR